MDLKTFAQSHPRYAKCKVCVLSTNIQKEICEGWEQGVRAAAIVAWLKDEKKIEGIILINVRNHMDHIKRQESARA